MTRNIKVKTCKECGGEMEQIPNVDYHINPNICISILQDKLEKVDGRSEKLLLLCEKFVDNNQISCPEHVYQSDNVIFKAQEFIHRICDLVGYYEFAEDEK